ncbi:unnamed protein product [Gongylonema pulchrum]|uniref:Uncharacterized protein n=1 Tax=Gongylonema pulchrum TaxID=637853 RepID=A0A183E330_9BILA|nr:unnamed protein product [Gongylonema pulchrum]
MASENGDKSGSNQQSGLDYQRGASGIAQMIQQQALCSTDQLNCLKLRTTADYRTSSGNADDGSDGRISIILPGPKPKYSDEEIQQRAAALCRALVTKIAQSFANILQYLHENEFLQRLRNAPDSSYAQSSNQQSGLGYQRGASITAQMVQQQAVCSTDQLNSFELQATAYNHIDSGNADDIGVKRNIVLPGPKPKYSDEEIHQRAAAMCRALVTKIAQVSEFFDYIFLLENAREGKSIDKESVA